MSENITNSDNLTPGQDQSLSSQFALRVALQTMKERCMSLQERLKVVEEENYSLKNQIPNDFPSDLSEKSQLNDLRKQVTDLLQEKSQLTEHINMVASENRQLWSRLSQLSKERQKTNVDKINTTTSSILSATGQNLIRSKTFTQHSPNPNLRHKNIDENIEKPLSDLSLEDIELSNYVGNDNQPDDMAVIKTNLGFGYLNDDSSSAAVGSGSIDNELILDSKNCIDLMYEMKQKVSIQHEKLKLIVKNLQRNKYVVSECHDCAKIKKPETADKSLETDESLNGSNLLVPQISTEHPVHESNNVEDLANTNIDIINQKILADEVDKICPMCGKIYASNLSFNEFQGHVEQHFIDENSDSDPTQFERNYEFVSHTVGNF